MGEVVLSRKVNEFVPKTRWIVSLSNGETIFEDHRSDEAPAWERLARYVLANNLSITGMRVQFDSGLKINLPSGQEGYVQKKKAWCTGNAGGILMCIGHVEGKVTRIYEASSSGDSVCKILSDPGPPWTIYRMDIRDKKCS